MKGFTLVLNCACSEGASAAWAAVAAQTNKAASRYLMM
jgi:hypothetical protein